MNIQNMNPPEDVWNMKVRHLTFTSTQRFETTMYTRGSLIQHLKFKINLQGNDQNKQENTT